MKRARKIVGRRFSKREIETAQTEFGEFELVQLDWDSVWGVRTLERLRSRAREVLQRNGVDVDAISERCDSPHGSAVLDHVLNFLGREPDSPIGLAALIHERTLHALAYMKMPDETAILPSLAFELGRLTMVAKVYEIENTGYGKGGEKTAAIRQNSAAARDAKLALAALAIRAANPALSLSDIAAKLADRGHGGKEAIRKKLPRLLNLRD